MIKKRIILRIFVIVTIFLIFVTPKTIALAGFNIHNFSKSSGLEKTGEGTGHAYMPMGGYTLEENIVMIVTIALSLVGIFFMLLLFYSGYLWITAMDNSKAIDKAKENIKTALIGLIIVLSAYIITKLILGLLNKVST